jgi:hypothetical protein
MKQAALNLNLSVKKTRKQGKRPAKSYYERA